MMRRLLAALAVLLALVPALAPAHELSIAELNLRERIPGEFQWHWGTGGIGRQPREELTLRWPQGCTVDLDRIDCPQGLDGTVEVEGLGNAYSALMLKVTWLDRNTRIHTLSTRNPTVRLYGTSEDRRRSSEIAGVYSVLGVEHILGGIDHLLFVVCLLFLVGFNRRLVWTITAFTAAHSLTLIASALGWLVLRGPPVEAVIAASIVLMAAEALKREDTLARRAPAIVAFGFGLVHGLGFAGALKEIGLPDNHLLLALLTFNVGVEIGQLLAVIAALALTRALSGFAFASRVPAPALYLIGTIAAFWTIERVAAVVSG